MQRFLALALVVAALASQPGCATYVAVSMPGPIEDESIRPGMNRTEVETVLNTGPASEFEHEELTRVRYEYADGPAQGTKVRALVYIAGDVFLLFLSEIVFWPIELYADNRIQRVGLADYDASFDLHEWKVSRTGGEVLETSYLGGDGEVIRVVERGDRPDVANTKIAADLRRRREAEASVIAERQADPLPAVSAPPPDESADSADEAASEPPHRARAPWDEAEEAFKETAPAGPARVEASETDAAN